MNAQVHRRMSVAAGLPVRLQRGVGRCSVCYAVLLRSSHSAAGGPLALSLTKSVGRSDVRHRLSCLRVQLALYNALRGTGPHLGLRGLSGLGSAITSLTRSFSSAARLDHPSGDLAVPLPSAAQCRCCGDTPAAVQPAYHGTGSPPATSAPGLGPHHPHLQIDRSESPTAQR